MSWILPIDDGAPMPVPTCYPDIMSYMPGPTITMLKVSDEDIERIARRVVELLAKEAAQP